MSDAHTQSSAVTADSDTGTLLDTELLYAHLQNQPSDTINNIDALEIVVGDKITLSREQLQILLDEAYARGVRRVYHDTR